MHTPYLGPCDVGLRVDDVKRAGAVVADMRKIIRQDPRIIQKLHRRVFIDKLTREQVRCGRQRHASQVYKHRFCEGRSAGRVIVSCACRMYRARDMRASRLIREQLPDYLHASSDVPSMSCLRIVFLLLRKGLPAPHNLCRKRDLSRAQVSVYVSFYVEATNRDAYMAIKQDLLLAFIDCVERNGAKLAKQLLLVRQAPLRQVSVCLRSRTVLRRNGTRLPCPYTVKQGNQGFASTQLLCHAECAPYGSVVVCAQCAS